MKNSSISVLLIFCGLLSATSLAQWSPDPYENLKVRDTAGMIVVPHVAVDPQGSSYISWYSATEGLRFDVYLQYFDLQGVKQWPEPGLLVSNHETDSWVSDYGLIMDQEGCAVLVTQDLRDGYSNAYAYRISRDGQMIWGPDGIRLTEDEDDNFAPQVILIPGNDFIFLNNVFPLSQSESSKLNLKMIGNGGNLIWDKTIMMEMRSLYFGQMLVTEDERLILSYLAKDDFPDTVIGQTHYINVFLEKFDMEGNSLWPAPVQADSGQVMPYGALYTIPYLANDGAGGAYVVWQSFAYDNPTILANHIDANGDLTWPGHGTPVSVNYNNAHTDPDVVYNAAKNNLFVLFQEYQYDGQNLTDCWAVAGQKFSPEGERLWSDTAKYLVPMMCAVDTAYLEVCSSEGPDNTLLFAYNKDYLKINGQDTSIVSEIYCSMIDTDGNYLWEHEIIPLSLAQGAKFHSDLSIISNNQWIYTWEDYRSQAASPGNSGIYAQNVTIDGNLGPLRISESSSSDRLMMNCFPNPCSDRLVLEYELGHRSETVIMVYDFRGNILMIKNDGIKEKGAHHTEIILKNISPGIYFLKLQSGEINEILKIIKIE